MEKSNYYSGLNRMWWFPLISVLIFIGLGIWCLCDPAPFLKVLAYVFAGIVGAVGVFNLFYGICNYNTYGGWGISVAAGIVEILFCFFLFFIPEPLLAYVFVYGVGLYIIFMAIYSFFQDFMLARSNSFWFFWLILFAVTSIAFSLIFILGPGAPELVGWIWIGVSFICYGAYRVILGSRIRAFNKELSNQ